MNEFFRLAAARVACALGSPWAFLAAVAFVVTWALLGPALDYSENWQLVINTGTSIATFLMLFILQNSQNRDTKAINIKLDELLRAIAGARTSLVTVGELSDEEIGKLEAEFRTLASGATVTSREANKVEPVGAAAAAPKRKRQANRRAPKADR